MHFDMHLEQHLSLKCSLSNSELFCRPAKRAKAVSSLLTPLAASDLCSVVGVEDEEGALLGPWKREGESILFIEVSCIVIFEIGVSIISKILFFFSRVQ